MVTPPAAGPAGLPMVDLLVLADAVFLLDRLALLVTMRCGGDRKTVVFGILEELQKHLDSASTARESRGAREIVDVVRAWFAMRIADEESRTGNTPQ